MIQLEVGRDIFELELEGNAFEYEMRHGRIFQGQPGKDATINGHNAVTLEGDNETVDVTPDPEDDSRLHISVRGHNAYDSLAKVEPYLYDIRYKTIDYGFARQYLRGSEPVGMGGCSARLSWRSRLVGMTFDWKYNHRATFAIHTAADQGRHEVWGVAGMDQLTADMVDSGVHSELYRILPFMLTDGFNSKGLFAKMNVVHRYDSSNDIVEPSGNIEDEICALMLVRYALDHYDSVEDAVNNIMEHLKLYNHASLIAQGYELHFMLADAQGNCAILEFTEGGYYLNEEYDIMTNFRLLGFGSNDDNSVYTQADLAHGHGSPVEDNGIELMGSGLERWNILNNGGQVAPESVEEMQSLMRSVYYSHAYSIGLEGDNWYSEFVGGDIDLNTPDNDPALEARHLVYAEKWQHRDRDTAEVWHTSHMCVYDLEALEMFVTVQEGDTSHKFFFEPGPVMSINGRKPDEDGNVSGLPEDVDVVHKTGDETIGGNKHFTDHLTILFEQLIDENSEEDLFTKLLKKQDKFPSIAVNLEECSIEKFNELGSAIASNIPIIAASDEDSTLCIAAKSWTEEGEEEGDETRFITLYYCFGDPEEGAIIYRCSLSNHNGSDDVSFDVESVYNLSGIKSGASKGATSVQTVNNIAPDANGNVNVQGSAGTYAGLPDKPQINGVTLQGNKTAEQLGLQPSDYILNPYVTGMSEETFIEACEAVASGKRLIIEVVSPTSDTPNLTVADDVDREAAANYLLTFSVRNGLTINNFTIVDTGDDVYIQVDSTAMQEQIDDLAEIRDNAEAGAAIVPLVPSQASPTNQIADKDFVNSSIQNVAAYYITKDAAGNPFATKAELTAATVFYSGGQVRVPTRNDYLVVLADESKTISETGENPTTRYIYDNNVWSYQYIVNRSGLTAAQWAAVTSGITMALVGKLGALPTAAELTTLLFGKVDKDAGKGLSTNDYDNTEKTKVAGAEQTGNKVLAISKDSTNTQYPGAKATYDAINPAKQSTIPSGGMLPNVLYNLGELSGAVSMTLATPADSTICNHYFFTFSTGAAAPTITWDAKITSWMGGSAPTINARKHYEVSVLDGVGVIMEV